MELVKFYVRAFNLFSYTPVESSTTAYPNTSVTHDIRILRYHELSICQQPIKIEIKWTYPVHSVHPTHNASITAYAIHIVPCELHFVGFFLTSAILS